MRNWLLLHIPGWDKNDRNLKEKIRTTDQRSSAAAKRGKMKYQSLIVTTYTHLHACVKHMHKYMSTPLHTPTKCTHTQRHACTHRDNSHVHKCTCTHTCMYALKDTCISHSYLLLTTTAHCCGEGSGIFIHLAASIKFYIQEPLQELFQMSSNKRDGLQIEFPPQTCLIRFTKSLRCTELVANICKSRSFIEKSRLSYSFEKGRGLVAPGPQSCTDNWPELAQRPLQAAPVLSRCAECPPRLVCRFSNGNVCVHHLENLVKMYILIQKVQGEA